jgi:hypothetical protein
MKCNVILANFAVLLSSFVFVVTASADSLMICPRANRSGTFPPAWKDVYKANLFQTGNGFWLAVGKSDGTKGQFDLTVHVSSVPQQGGHGTYETYSTGGCNVSFYLPVLPTGNREGVIDCGSGWYNCVSGLPE